ncbi:MAG: tautomerase family protein [Rhizomicrobium sp.]
MPFISVHIAAGRPLEKRRRLVQAITDAVTEILELERGATQVLIHEQRQGQLGHRRRTPQRAPHGADRCAARPRRAVPQAGGKIGAGA